MAELQTTVSDDAAKLNQVASELVAASRVSPDDLSAVANNFANAYSNVITHSMMLAGATKVRVTVTMVTMSPWLPPTHPISSGPGAPIGGDPAAPELSELLKQAALTEQVVCG